MTTNATTSQPVTPTAAALFRPGDLVDITIKGARVMEPKAGLFDILTLAYEEVGPGVFATIELRHPRANTVTIERAAPAEWPPQRSDVWMDRHGARWFAAEHCGGPAMHSEGGAEVSPDHLLENYAPLTLAYRAGDGTR